jgi:hypothetical protein
MEIANAGEPVILPAARILPEAREPLPEYVGPSNRVNAVGQMAKSAVQDARNAGAELPRNAQGQAASRIARGADPESVFSALIADIAPATDGEDGPGLLVETPGDGGGLVAPAEDTGSGAVLSLAAAEGEGSSPAETALDILAEDQVA